jgi:hypothetical protein
LASRRIDEDLSQTRGWARIFPRRAVNRPAEPPAERWVNSRVVGDHSGVAHLTTLLSGSVLVYAGVTRGALLVARLIERVAGR